MRWIFCGVVGLLALAHSGCVRRTIAITSTPADALVYVNDREIGRTPCEVEFMFYGEYDVRIKRDGYESVIGSGTASAPIWDFIGADLVAEMAPIALESRVEWHFELIPSDNSHNDLLVRARALRESVTTQATLTWDERGESTWLGSPPAPTASPTEEPAKEGALPKKGSAEVPVPPTDLPAEIPGGAPGTPLPTPESPAPTP